MEQNKPKKSFRGSCPPATTERRSSYSRERYEKNKEILKNHREKYRKQTNKELIDIKVMRGTFILYFN